MFLYVLDEEDIHQCGRCKEWFTSIDAYFSHKKSKTCSKVHSKTFQLSSSIPQADISVDAPHILEAINTQPSTEVLLESQTDDTKSYEPVEEAGDCPQTDDAVLYQEEPATTENVSTRTRRCRPRAAPKKVWVEDYNEEMGLDEIKVPDDASRKPVVPPIAIKQEKVDSDGNLQPDLRPKRKRGRPPGKRNKIRGRKPPLTSPPQVAVKQEGNDDEVVPVLRVRRSQRGAINKYVSSGKSYCPSCDYQCRNKVEFDRHLRTSHNLTSHVCPQCSKPFSDKYKLSRHMETSRCNHQPEGAVNTSQFTKFTKNNKVYRNTHFPVDTGADSEREENMLKDVKIEPVDTLMEVITEDFSCVICKEQCENYTEILDHLGEVHPGIHPGVCRFCGHWLTSKYKLMRHILSSLHDDVPNDDLMRFKADISIMSVNWNVKQGQNRKKMLLACAKCSKRFTNKVSLNRHLKTAHNNSLKMFKLKCYLCKKVFDHKKHLVTHLKEEHNADIEMNGKPAGGSFCRVCDRHFKNRYLVAQHMDSLHIPLQHVPEFINLEPENIEQLVMEQLKIDSTKVDSTKAPTGDLADSAMTNIVFDCVVCCRHMDNFKTYLTHMQQHRVWVANSVDGPKPHDLFEKMYSTNTIPAPTSMVSKHQDKADTAAEEQATINDQFTSSEQIQDSLENSTLENDLTQQLPESDSLTTIDHTQLSTLMHEPTENVWSILSEYGQLGHQASSKEDPLKSVDLQRPHLFIAPNVSSGESPQLVFPDVNTSASDSLGLMRIEHLLGDHAYIMPTTNPQASAANILSTKTIPEVVCDAGQPWDNFVAESVTDSHIVSVKAYDNIRHKAKVVATPSDVDLSNKGYLCPYCLQYQESTVKMYAHKIESHKLVAEYRCALDECRLLFKNVVDYREHASKHSQRAFICNICNDHFENVTLMTMHKCSAHRDIHRQDAKRCGVCQQAFDSKEALTTHVEETPNHYQCEHCGKVLKKPCELKDHLLKHQDVKAYLCDKCGGSFVNNLALARHKTSHNSVKRFQCEHCPVAFNKNEHLKRHVVSRHSTETPFRCEHPNCSKSFKRKDKLNEHKKMHSSEKPYVCHICGTRYRYREGLKYHEKTHERSTKHICYICGTAFPQPSQLRTHLSIVHNSKMKRNHVYICEECHLTFSRPERLKRHKEREHRLKTEWPYNCSFCKMGFAGKKSLTTHVRRSHKEKTKTGYSHLQVISTDNEHFTNAFTLDVTGQSNENTMDTTTSTNQVKQQDNVLQVCNIFDIPGQTKDISVTGQSNENTMDLTGSTTQVKQTDNVLRICNIFDVPGQTKNTSNTGRVQLYHDLPQSNIIQNNIAAPLDSTLENSLHTVTSLITLPLANTSNMSVAPLPTLSKQPVSLLSGKSSAPSLTQDMSVNMPTLVAHTPLDKPSSVTFPLTGLGHSMESITQDSQQILNTSNLSNAITGQINFTGGSCTPTSLPSLMSGGMAVTIDGEHSLPLLTSTPQLAQLQPVLDLPTATHSVPPIILANYAPIPMQLNSGHLSQGDTVAGDDNLITLLNCSSVHL